MRGPFWMTLKPTGDEVVLATAKAVPASDDPEDKELALEINKNSPTLSARVWEGHTNRGLPVEVAIVKILKIHPKDEERLDALLEGGDLPTQIGGGG